MSNTPSENTSGLSKKDKMYYIHSAIGLALMFLFGFLPPFGPVTELGMKFLGIFLGLIYLWSFVDMGWPILASFAALVALDCMPISQIYTSAFSNQIVLMCLFTMLVIMPLAETGIFDYVANWLLKQPFLKGHPWRLTIGLIALVYIGCICHGGMAILFMVYALTYKVCDMCDMEHSHPWAGAIIMGATVSFVIGGAAMPFSGLALFMMGIFVPVQGFQWPFVEYIIFMFLMEIVIMGFFILSIKLLRVDMSKLKNADVSSSLTELPPISKYQKQAASMLAIFILCLIIAGIAPNLPANPITGVFAKLGLVGISWLFMCFMIIWRIKSKAAFTLNDMAVRVPWDSILIICIGMSFGPAITSDATGIGALLYQITSPIFAGHGEFAFTLIVCLVTLILTNFFNNTVVAMLMVSVIASYAPSMNLNIVTLAAVMLVASQMAMLLPGASYYAGLAHGQAAHTGRKNGFVWGAMIMIASALALPIMLVIGNMLF